MQCAQTVACNRFCCNGWSYLRACPMSILVLLNARLGCTLASLCCSVYCFVGCECPALVTAPKLNCLITDCKVADGYMRIVFLGSEAPYGFLPIFTFRVMQGFNCITVSIWDSASAARVSPMQLSGLRASLCHRTYNNIRLRWICPVADFISSAPGVASKPTFVSAAFSDSGAATHCQQLAARLEELYAGRHVTSA